MTILFIAIISLPCYAQQTDNDNYVARVITIGDAGVLSNGKHTIAEAVGKHIDMQDKKTTILLLGDNIYTYGLPIEEDNSYAAKKEVILKQVQPFFNHNARVYVIPGNHDWASGGKAGWINIKNQARVLAKLGKSNISFLPQDGCPGPEVINLSDSAVLVIMDSQWWLHEHEKPESSSDCDCKTEAEITARLNDIAYKNRHKNILVAMHHPLRSYGIHGGYYTLKQHIFPVTDMVKDAYIPLPIIGSIYPIVRGKFGNIQDLMHPVYKHMIETVENVFKDNPNITYVAGHEHNMQLLTDKGRTYIVSGSGAKTSRVKKGKLSRFATEKKGFTEILYLKNGDQQIIFYEVSANGTVTKLHERTTPYKTAYKKNIRVVKSKKIQDSISVAIAPAYDSVSGFHRLLFGKHYRALWATPVKMEVFNINTEQGGLSIVKKGGGQQTKSLRLQDKTGKQWVLRTVQKDPEKALPSYLKGTVGASIVQDQISAANPYAPLTIPILATAAGVPHANPKIVYIPDDTALGVYRKEFAETVCLFEEREPIDGKTYSTFKILDKLEKDNDNIIDEQAVLKARMLDLLIGDWDRHEDQWRWGVKKLDKKNIYFPIPRDRDQVYFISTGILPYISARSWLLPKFQGFGKKVRNVNGFMFNARHFDRYFLHNLDQEQWTGIITELQNDLSDDIIKKAVLQLPDTIFKQVGTTIIANIISRRNNLLETGLKYYRFLNRYVEIPATDKRDFLTISYKRDQKVKVTLQKTNKEHKPTDTFYSRTLDPKVTKEIRVYGRGGKDIFIVKGSKKSKIRTRLIGGGKADGFYIDKAVDNKSGIYIYDRSDKKNTLPNKKKALIKTSNDNTVNEYNGRSFEYDKLVPLVTGGYNLDDGIIIGGGAMYTKHGFRKQPYAAKHSLSIRRAFATNAGSINYKGDITDAIGSLDLDMKFTLRVPDNTENFFGIGNESQFLEKSTPIIRYYRTRYHFSELDVNLKHVIEDKIQFIGGLSGQYYDIDEVGDNAGRYIIEYNAQNPSKTVFDQKWFLGANIGFDIDTRNDKTIPIRGMRWVTTVTGMQQLNETKKSYGLLKTEMSLLMSFNRYPKIVFGNRIGLAHSIGDPYFFQLLYLGGGNLQGFRKKRFAGTSMIYNNFELRFKLFDFTSYLFPGSVGLIGFNDIGRVWVDNEQSDKWHVGYGGGLYIIPAQTIVVSSVLGYSEEGLLPYISLGFRF